MLTIFITPVIVLNSGMVATPLLLFSMYILIGLGKAGVGMGVMHDALHGSYSSNRKVNRFMGYTMNLIGANANLWKIQHNVLHHTYTNIEDVDEDIKGPGILRFSPHAKWLWLHKFQFIYAWFFYGLSTVSWATFKDFKSIVRYKKMGFYKGSKEYRREVWKVMGWKLVYFSYTLIIPLIVIPLPFWMIILGFMIMHFITGFSITTVFQTAHVVPSSKFPLPDKNGLIANDWSIHQLATTTNFSPRSRIFSWMIGGLNYQIEHHLLPNICHIHYSKISSIVKETAREYGIAYNTNKTFVNAVWEHLKMLYRLGRIELAVSNNK